MRKVTAAVIERNGKVLIARRKRGDPLEQKWEFPGGKVEPNETPEECLRRELLEEFGVLSEIGEFLCSSRYDYSHMSIELLAFRVSHISDAFTLKDHDEIRWIAPDEFDDYDFAEADKQIVRRLLEMFSNGIRPKAKTG